MYPTGDVDFPEEMMPAIEKFFAKIHPTLRPGEDLYPEVFDTAFFPLQRKRETIQMIRLARSRSPKIVYEVGADKAGGLYHWCQCIDTVERVIACEIRGTPYKHLFEAAFPHLDFLWIEASSFAPESVEGIKRWLGTDLIDVVFSDGDKGSFRRDFPIYLDLMRPDDGLILLHDITDEAPGDCYRAIVENLAHYEIIDTSESDEAMQRIAAGEPATTDHEHWLRYWHGRSCGVGVIPLGEET